MGTYVLAIEIKWCGPWHGIVVASSSQVQLLYGRGLESRYGWEKNRIYKKRKEGSCPGAMVMEETHVPKVVGSNPSTVYWMDVFSHVFVAKIVMTFA